MSEPEGTLRCPGAAFSELRYDFYPDAAHRLAFGFTPVSWTEYGIALALAVLVIPIVELVKLIQRRLGK